MAGLGFSDLLSLVQSIVLIGALGVTLYFSRLQMRAQRTDLETRVLNDLDEKLHNMAAIFMDDPTLVKLIYDAPGGATKEQPGAYYILFLCAHAFHMRERGVLGDNEWTGWFQWMKNAFHNGTIGRQWKEEQMENWFDPSFRTFVNTKLLPPSGQAKEGS